MSQKIKVEYAICAPKFTAHSHLLFVIMHIAYLKGYATAFLFLTANPAAPISVSRGSILSLFPAAGALTAVSAATSGFTCFIKGTNAQHHNPCQDRHY